MHGSPSSALHLRRDLRGAVASGQQLHGSRRRDMTVAGRELTVEGKACGGLEWPPFAHDTATLSRDVVVSTRTPRVLVRGTKVPARTSRVPDDPCGGVEPPTGLNSADFNQQIA